MTEKDTRPELAADEPRYPIGELARLAGISRRAVRYYVQRGLLPTPEGVGRGAHYTAEHLAILRRIRALQEQGATLDEIGALLEGRAVAPVDETRQPVSPSPSRAAEQPPDEQAWTRAELAPGLELHLDHDRYDADARRAIAAQIRAALARLPGWETSPTTSASAKENDHDRD